MAAALPTNTGSTYGSYCTLTLATNIVQIMKLNTMELTSLQIGRPRNSDSIRGRSKKLSSVSKHPRTVVVNPASYSVRTRGSYAQVVHSPASSAVINYVWSYTSTYPYALVT